MVQEGTSNLNFTLKGLFGQKALKTQQMIQIQLKRRGLSLTQMDQGQTYKPKRNPKQLLNESIGFNWDDSAHSAHNTAKVCD